MDNNLLIAIIRISEILRSEYGLNLKESVECINSFIDIQEQNNNKYYLEFFLHTSYSTWAERMYEYYNNSVKVLKHKNN